MKVGIGLPTTLPRTPGSLVLDWARAADVGPFSTLGVFDRVVYDSYDPLISLAAAAAVTSRVRLATTILTGPLYNTTLLAKATASLDSARADYVGALSGFAEILDAERTLLEYHVAHAEAVGQREMVLAEMSLVILGRWPAEAPPLVTEQTP